MSQKKTTLPQLVGLFFQDIQLHDVLPQTRDKMDEEHIDVGILQDGRDGTAKDDIPTMQANSWKEVYGVGNRHPGRKDFSHAFFGLLGKLRNGMPRRSMASQARTPAPPLKVTMAVRQVELMRGPWPGIGQIHHLIEIIGQGDTRHF